MKAACEHCGANLALVGRAHRCIPRDVEPSPAPLGAEAPPSARTNRTNDAERKALETQAREIIREVVGRTDGLGARVGRFERKRRRHS